MNARTPTRTWFLRMLLCRLTLLDTHTRHLKAQAEAVLLLTSHRTDRLLLLAPVWARTTTGAKPRPTHTQPQPQQLPITKERPARSSPPPPCSS